MNWAYIQLALLAALGAGVGYVHLRLADEQRGLIERLVEREAKRAAPPALQDQPDPDSRPGHLSDHPSVHQDESSSVQEPVDPTPAPAPDTVETPPPSPGEYSINSLDTMITLDQARWLLERAWADETGQTEVYFIDARSRREYVEGRIWGALLISPQDLSRGVVPEILEFTSKETPLVIYCEGGDCDASHMVRDRLMLSRYGFTNVFIMGDGFPGWRDAGLPIESGEPQ